MSFYSSLKLVRPTQPPIVTVDALSRFLRSIDSLGILTSDQKVSCNVKYGQQIDADDKGTEVRTYVNEGVFKIGEIEWDYTNNFSSLAAMADSLLGNQQTIYRGYVNLGELLDEIGNALTREPSEENEIPLFLSDVSFEMGPITTYSLMNMEEAQAGWMGLSFSGYGYFYPWTYQEARQRIEKVEQIAKLVELCEKTWPVVDTAVTGEVAANRESVKELWLYNDFHLPHAWRWFVAESG